MLLMSLLLATCLALASGHHGTEGEEEHCHCGVFATEHDGLTQLDEFPHEHLADCSMVQECKDMCQRAWDNNMGSGDLDTIITDPDTTQVMSLGQRFCNNIKGGQSNFGPVKVHGYSSICHGPLLYDNRESQQHLCCRNGLHKKCTVH